MMAYTPISDFPLLAGIKMGLFCSRTRKARNVFRGLTCHVSGKRGDFFKIYSNSLVSNLFRGSNLRQNPCLGGDFCILTKMCLGVYFKTIHTCVHLYI